MKPSKEEIKAVLDEVEDLNLSDGAYWALCHERLGLQYGALFSLMGEDPAYFGMTETRL